VQGLSIAEQAAVADAFTSVGITETPRIKIVLTWGSTPNDLDSHLTGPDGNGGRFHVYYANRDYFQDATSGNGVSVDLDYDDTSSYGPESTTIRNPAPGDYYFYVYDYSDGGSTDSTVLSHSGATVTVYKQGQVTNGTVFRVDGSSPGTNWTVFKLTVANNGAVTVTRVNNYSYADPYGL
jgi:uncharacterized protein YfaP (DUF2135 family)